MAERQYPKPQTDKSPPAGGKPDFLSRDEDEMIDRESKDSFPASDPPSHTPVTRAGKPSRPKPRRQ